MEDTQIDLSGVADDLQEYHEEIIQAIVTRTSWEKNQEIWYQMRHNGLGRRFKPWPGAADMHDPLSDTIIGAQKPVDIEQLYATELLAEFLSEESQANDDAELASRFFDWHVKHKSNFIRKLMRSDDSKWQNGKGLGRGYWDDENDCLCTEMIDPINLIVPEGTDRLNDPDDFADWMVVVEKYSVSQFMRRKEFSHFSEEEARQLAGTSSYETSQKEFLKDVREGLMYSNRKDQIIVWRRYEKKWIKDKYHILVTTYSPHEASEKLRDDFYLNDLDDMYPVWELTAEEKENGYYSSRGIPERVASEEAANSRSLNAQSDYDTLVGRPIYSTGGQYLGQQNIKAYPGQIVNADLKQTTALPSPIDYDARINAARSRAEQRVQSYQSTITRPDQSTGDKRTAKEMGLVEAYASRGDTLNSRLFRMDLGQAYAILWRILKNRKKDDLTYYYQQEKGTLKPEILESVYHILPNGSGDNFSKQFRIQVALAMFNTFKGHPNVKQGALVKDVIESIDSRKIKDLYQDDGQAQAAQQLEQARENLILQTGCPVPAALFDDDGAHLGEVDRFIQREAAAQRVIAPDEAKVFLAHAEQHLQNLKKKNPAQYKQINIQMHDVFAFLAELADIQPPQPMGAPAMGAVFGHGLPVIATNQPQNRAAPGGPPQGGGPVPAMAGGGGGDEEPDMSMGGGQ